MTAVAQLAAQRPTSWLTILGEAVRPEFQAELIRIDVENPVFARGRCAVDGCDRGGWSRRVCDSHYNRWKRFGKPDLKAFAATAGPIAQRAGSERVDAFDLAGLPEGLRLEGRLLHPVPPRRSRRSDHPGDDPPVRCAARRQRRRLDA